MYEDSPFEDVFTIDDWYDRPLAGFALYDGAPHHYYSLGLDEDDWDTDEDRFDLVPVSTELLQAGLEAKSIFERWDAIRQQTKSAPIIANADFGALPEDRTRYAVLRAMITPLEAPGHPHSFTVRGRFEVGCKRVQWRDDPASVSSRRDR